MRLRLIYFVSSNFYLASSNNLHEIFIEYWKTIKLTDVLNSILSGDLGVYFELKIMPIKNSFRISNTTCQGFYVFTIWNVKILSLSLNRESEQDTINIQGAMFILMQFMGVCNCSGILPYIFTERNVAYRERFSGMYSLWAYSFAQVLNFPKAVVSLLPMVNVIFYILQILIYKYSIICCRWLLKFHIYSFKQFYLL